MSNRLSTTMQLDLINTNVYSGGYLVVITFNNGNTIRLSNIGENITDEQDVTSDIYYEDRGLRISNISESIDFKEHKYKISSTTIEVSNLLKDGVRFSDLINSDVNEIVNSRVEIFYKTQNIKSLDSSLRVYYGVATKCTMTSDKVSIQIEDDSTNLFQNATLPKSKQNGSLILNDSFSETTIPMCFGTVDKAPLLPQKLRNDSTDMALIADDIYNFNIRGNMNKLYVLIGNTYFDVPNTSHILNELLVDTGGNTEEDFQKFNNNEQWFSDGGSKFITIPRDFQDSEYDLLNNQNHFNPLNLAAKGYLQVRYIRRPNADPILSENSVDVEGGDGGIVKYVGDRYGFDRDDQLYTFPKVNGDITYEGLVWNFGIAGVLFDQDEDTSEYTGGNTDTVYFLHSQQDNSSLITDNGFELVYTPMSMPTNSYLEESWKDYLRFLISRFYAQGMANVAIYVSINQIDLESLYPDSYQYENDTERLARYFIDELVWPAGRVAINNDEHIQYFKMSELTDPSEPYCWGWGIDKNEIASQYENGSYITEDAGLNLRFLKMWMPTSININNGELTDYQCVSDGRGGNSTFESIEGQQDFIESSREVYWSNSIGLKVNESGTRVGGLLPTIKLDVLMTPTEYYSNFPAISFVHIDDYIEDAPHAPLGIEQMMVSNIHHSFGRPATQADGENFTNLDGEQGWWAGYTGEGGVSSTPNDYILPGKPQWPAYGQWSNHFLNNPGNDFSFYMEYGGKKGIYTNIVNSIEADNEDVVFICTLQSRSKHGETDKELYYGVPRNGWYDKIEIMHTGLEAYVDGDEGVEDYSERFRVILPLENISTTNILSGSAQSLVVCKIDSDLKMRSLLSPAVTSTFDIKTMLANQDGANKVLFEAATSSSSFQDFIISSEEDNQFQEYDQDVNHTPEILGSMVIRDLEWTDLDNRTDLIFDMGMKGTGSSAGVANFNLILESPHVYQTALLGSIEEAKFFGFVQGRVDDASGKYTGSPNALIEKPSDIIYNIITEEMGYNQDTPVGMLESRGTHSEMKYSFSQQKETDFKKFLDEFSVETKSIPKFRVSDGAFKFVNKTDTPQGEQGQYDWALDDSDIIKQSFAKTPVKDIVLKCRVLFDFDYGLKKFLKSTDEPGYGAIPNNYEDYIDYYNIQNVEPHYLEIEAKHIRDMATAKELRNHVLEYRKNTYLEMTLELPMKYIFVEAGDTFIYRNIDDDNNPIYRGDFKPYGIDYMNDNSLLGQEISYHWVVKSVVKKQDRVTVKANQFHYLNPDNVIEQSPTFNNDLVSGDSSSSSNLEQTTIVLGDVNLDGTVDVLDIVSMVNIILGNAEPEELEVFVSDE